MATNVFNSLPVDVQQRIDRAFDSVGKASGRGGAMGGGFVVEAGMGGGFVRDDDEEEELDKPTQLSMVEIPRALQELDLAPDDEQVLAVFRNAASGWTAASSDEVDDTGGGWVSRDDWRSVCAVLLEHHKEEYQDESDGPPLQQFSDEDAGSDDQYLGSEGDDEEDSGDEYIESSTSATRRRTRAPAAKSSSTSPAPEPTPSERKLTKRQQEATLEAFALFFPEVPEEEIPKQKIMIKDIQRFAKLLGEKIKADEMVEMLDAFSTSPDKSVSMEDFGRIMVAARLA